MPLRRKEFCGSNHGGNVCLFVCLFRSQAIPSCEHPQGSGFLRARTFVLPPQEQSCSDFGEMEVIEYNLSMGSNPGKRP